MKKSNKGQIKLTQEPSSSPVRIKSGIRAGAGTSFKSFKPASFVG
jgi:hypothetical protein